MFTNEKQQLSVLGDALSCYTTSIATYMQYVGIDYLSVMGTQLFLAVQQPQNEAPLLRFIHYHTPLIGETPAYNLSLTHNMTDDIEVFLQTLSTQCKEYGATIVLGDAISLPWTVAYKRKHQPHWFVVTALDENKRALTIYDPLAFSNGEGTQQPFAGCIEYRHFAASARITSSYARIVQSRNDVAFGLEKKIAYEPLTPYQWFNTDSLPHINHMTPELKRELLQRTWEFQVGKRTREDLSPAGWTCGLGALSILRDFFSAYTHQAVVYEYSDDLWVASRQRYLFMETFYSIGKELHLPEITSFMNWGLEEYLPQWQVLPRILQYNFLRSQRGKKIVSSTFNDALKKATEGEEILVERLEKILL